MWDGRNDGDEIVEDGVYRPRVLLEENGRTIVLPNPIRVDTTAPRIRLLRVFPRVFSPDGDGQRDRLVAEYEIDEKARAMMLVDGRRRVLAKFPSTEGQLVWFGRFDGRAARPGTYEIRLRAFDRAGNRSSSRREVTVAVRYVELRATGSRSSPVDGSRSASRPTPCAIAGSSRGRRGRRRSACSSFARRRSRVTTGSSSRRSDAPTAPTSSSARRLIPSRSDALRRGLRDRPLGLGRVAASIRDQPAVEREEVRPLGRDARASSGPAAAARRSLRRTREARTSSSRASRRRRACR